MISAADIVAAVGPGLLRVVTAGRAPAVRDIALVEQAEPDRDHRGDLVVGVGLAGAEQAVELVERSAGQDASGLVLRSALADHPDVGDAASAAELCLVAAEPGVS